MPNKKVLLSSLDKESRKRIFELTTEDNV